MGVKIAEGVDFAGGGGGLGWRIHDMGRGKGGFVCATIRLSFGGNTL